MHATTAKYRCFFTKNRANLLYELNPKCQGGRFLQMQAQPKPLIRLRRFLPTSWLQRNTSDAYLVTPLMG